MEAMIHPDANQYVIFYIQEESYCLAIDEVIEIIRPRTITFVSGVKEYIEGVINLRGKIIPIINLRKRFKLAPIPTEKKSRILIVTGQEEEQIGLMVDEVRMVHFIQEAQLERPPDSFRSKEQSCIKSVAKVDNDVIAVIHLQQILYPEQQEGM
jgi:purine-binding chemotaxis protein CheW